MVEVLFDTVSSLHRDELSEPVKRYADNLSAQLQQAFKDQGVDSYEAFRSLAQQESMPLDTVKKIADLAGKLDEITKTGEMGFDEAAFMRHYDAVVSEWMEESIDIDQYHPGLLQDKYCRELPLIPLPVLQFDPHFLNRLYKRKASYQENTYEDKAGIFISLLYNQSLEDADERNKDLVYQEIDLRNNTEAENIDFIGFQHSGGTVRIFGDIASLGAVGFQMKAGEIIAQKIEIAGGDEMTGGILRVDEAQEVGTMMHGGTIYVKQVESFLGISMDGGTIYCDSIGELASFGYSMKGGSIYIESDLKLSDIAIHKKTGGDIYYKGKKIA